MIVVTSASLTMKRPNVPSSAIDIRRQMLEKLIAPVGDPSSTMVHVDKEMTTTLVDVATLCPGNDHHPAVRYLFNWLVCPQRTAEEFNYLIGPLQEHIYI